MRKLFHCLPAVAICVFSISGFAQKPDDAIVSGKDIAVTSTDAGKVRGYVHDHIFTYKGIPYAKADRFMAPSKPSPWKEVRSSMTYGPVCPIDPTTTVFDEIEFAFDHNWGYMNENCLSLNVWTPSVTDQKKRAVLVWFHGGGFSAGSSVELPSYDGENLSKKGDVVVVSVNHRLNVLGFLDLSAYGEKYKSSANAGLMDLVSALDWVKTNISNFGGDPANVTIFGQSGGGGKVTCLMNAPSAKGLFQKAIVESGSYISSFWDKSISQRVAAAVLEDLGLNASQVDSLQKMPYEKLSAASKKALAKVGNALKAEGKQVGIGNFGLMWGPTQDGSFLPNQPTDAAAIELSKDVPLLVGTTKNEFTPFLSGTRGIGLDSAKAIAQKRYGDKATSFMEAVKKAYPATTKPSDYLDVDLTFRPGAIKQANQKSLSPAPVYMYLFTWQSPVNDGMYKSMHCMELAFVFDNIKRCEQMTGGGKEAYALAEKVSSAWINFAKSGNPSAKELPAWPKYTKENGATMIFDNQCVLRNHPDDELLKIAGAL